MNGVRMQQQSTANGPAAAEYMRVGAGKTEFPGDAAEAGRQFRQFRAIHLRNLLDAEFLSTVMRLCGSSTFGPMFINCGYREKEEPQRTGRVLNLALNRPALLRWLEETTGCGPLGRVEGALARTLHRPGDELTWHDDAPEQGRRLAIVIHLSADAYGGGDFELRLKGGDLIFGHRYTDLNSALIFAVEPGLEHRVLPLTSGGPRLVFAGWAFAEGAA